MRKIATLFTMLLFFSAIAFGQNRTITGTVTDERGDAVPGASVRIKGTKTGVAADNAGQFRLLAKTGDVLEVSGASIESTEITVGAGSTLTVQAKSRATTGTEVVVTALGQASSKTKLGYSVASVKSTELTQGRVVNLQNGLTGKISGVSIATTNNGVFADTRITLRGIRSLTGNNQPMLVLDGVPMALGYLNSINPNDIADVSVLKSAAATVVYGPDGVNGAIIVTTKRGNKQKPVVTFSHTTQMEKVSYMPKFQELYGSGYAQDANGYGTYEQIEQQSWGDPFDGSIRQIGQDGPNGEKYYVPYSYIKNGRRDFYDVGLTHQTDVSLAAGDFYISAQNVSIRGTMPGDKNDRRAVNLRADKEYGKFKAGFTMRYTQSQYDVTNSNQLVYYGVTSAPGQIPLSRFSDWRNDYFSSPNGFYTPYLDNNGKTPYFTKDNNRETGNGDEFFGNAELNYSATSWLKFTYRVGMTFDNAEATQTRGAFTYSAFHGTLRDHGTQNITAAVNDISSIGKRLTSEVFANFNKKFNDFTVKALVGQSYRQTSSRYVSAGSNNMGSANLFTVQLRKGEPNVTVDNSKTRLERYFGKLELEYKNWAFLEGTASYDYDSRQVIPGMKFDKSDIRYFYPGVSASIVLTEAIPALKGNKVINYLKIRGSLAKSGSVPIGAYAFQGTFATSTFFPYGDVLGFQNITTIAPNSLQPEFVKTKEAGFEVSFLKNRINLEGTYYHQDNTNQVINVQLSNTVGTGNPSATAPQNAATFVNKGFELDLKLTPLVKIGKVNIDFKANYTKQTNEVLSLIGDVKELGLGNFNYAIVGQSAYMFKLVDYVRDPQGRVIVDAVTGMPSQDPNLRMFGRTSPTDFIGLSMNVKWKDLSFNAVADYRTGNQIVADQLGGFMDDNGISARSADNGRRAFIYPNSVYEDPANPGKYIENKSVYTQTYGRLFWNSDLVTAVTSNYLADGSFWKLRELSLSYEFPVAKVFGSGISKTIKGLTLSASGRNLFMWVPKSNVWTDPEFQGGNGNAAYTGNATGRSTAYNAPPTRIFGGTVVVRF